MLIVNDEQRLRAGIGSLGKRCQYCSLELVDHLRATPNGEHTPIILMSARMPREGSGSASCVCSPSPFASRRSCVWCASSCPRRRATLA